MSIWASLITALVALAGNAFFVGAEFGLISARRSSIELEALKGSLTAKITLKAMEQVSLMLAGVQLGVTVCSLVFGAISEPLMDNLLQQPFHNLGVSEIFIGPVALVATLAIMTYVHVVIGEMVPKNLALVAPAKVALVLIPPLVFVVKIFKPIIIAINNIAMSVIKLFGLQPKHEISSSFGRDDVAGFIKESLHEGLLSSKEGQLLSGSLHFDEATISSVIIPLNKVVFVSNHPTPAEIENLTSKTGFSRFPILKDNGQLKGYIHLKDILRIASGDYNRPLSKQLFRPLVSVKATSTLRQALTIMQHAGSHLAKVVGEDQMAVGIITFEDVLEELVGEIIDDTVK